MRAVPSEILKSSKSPNGNDIFIVNIHQDYKRVKPLLSDFVKLHKLRETPVTDFQEILHNFGSAGSLPTIETLLGENFNLRTKGPDHCYIWCAMEFM